MIIKNNMVYSDAEGNPLTKSEHYFCRTTFGAVILFAVLCLLIALLIIPTLIYEFVALVWRRLFPPERRVN